MSEEIKKEIKENENNMARTNKKLKIALIAAVAVIVIAGAVFAVSAAKGGSRCPMYGKSGFHSCIIAWQIENCNKNAAVFVQKKLQRADSFLLKRI